MEEPSTEVIEKYHKLYLEALTELYETHKAKYNIPEEMKLQFVQKKLCVYSKIVNVMYILKTWLESSLVNNNLYSFLNIKIL